MKFSIAKSELVDALGVVLKGMSSRSTLPILSGIYISASQEKLTFQTTDLEISVRHIVDALIEVPGDIVIPGKIFSEVVKSLPDAAIHISLEHEIFTVSCLESRFTLHTLNPADFPNFPEIHTEFSVSLPSKQLSSMVKKVSKAVSKDESRAVLTGILFKVEGDAISLVATDSYRLAISKARLEEPVVNDLELIIPGSIFDEISRLSTTVDTIEVGDSENQIVFHFSNTTFITRKIEGNYPNYEQIIPKEKSISAVIDTNLLLSAVRRASILAQSHTPVRFSLSSETQFLDISSTAQDIGGANEKVPAQIDGEDIEIGFNHQYIIDGLNVIDTDEVVFEAQTSLKPGIFKTVGGEYFFYLTMPVRLDK